MMKKHSKKILKKAKNNNGYKTKIESLKFKLSNLGYDCYISKDLYLKCFKIRVINNSTRRGIETIVDFDNYGDFTLYSFLRDCYNYYKNIQLTERVNVMNNTKMILTSNGEEIELPLYNKEDFKVDYPTLDDYKDFILEINGKKFNVMILKSDFERIKDTLKEIQESGQ